MPGCLKRIKGKDLYILAVGICIAQYISNVIMCAFYISIQDLAYDSRINYGAIGRDTHNNIGSIMLCCAVKPIQDVFFAAPETLEVIFVTKLDDRFVGGFRRGRHNRPFNGRHIAQSVQYMPQHGTVAYRGKHFARHRGEIAEEAAVLAALGSGKLATYITDFPTAAVVEHPQIICSPHLGASTSESEEQCARMAVSQLKAYLEYGTVGRSVNFPTAESIPAANVHTRLIMINRDVPGMIGFASQTIGASGINIASYLNESNGVIGYNIIDLENGISDEVLALIEGHPGVIRTRTIRYHN